MPDTEQWDEAQFRAYVTDKYENGAGGVLARVQAWLDRGDGVAIYENHDLGHPELGTPRIVSYGSSRALLETNEPPQRLPDLPGTINWRYTLIATYRKKVP